ncbi:Xaa-Pro aminopeptidase [Pendulispora albinea]|uniref:Xaa-Pro aminopeptidase n=1 Tax=Pendulispora albinea TaxID=2741071 RepID=A0ABZ2LYC4_9BACT
MTGYALGGCAALAIGLSGCRASPRASPGAAQPEAGPKGAALYGAGLFTTGAWDFFMAFSPDQRSVLFGRADDAFEVFDILETRLGPDGHWSPPVKPRFAAHYSNADPHISPDGRRVFFISNRPEGGKPGEAPRPIHDIWVAERDAQGARGARDPWGEARHLPAPVNDGTNDRWSPAVAQNGNLHFGADLGGPGKTDLWVSRWKDGVYQAPENLGDAINGAGLEVEPWIAPDESYLIFAGLRRPDCVGSYDLFFSRRIEGRWEKPRPLTAVNTAASEFNHSVSPDGKWLYFSSGRRHAGPLGERFDAPRDDRTVAGVADGRKGDIYRIPMRELGLDVAPIAGGTR